jgi:hypothetical protein
MAGGVLIPGEQAETLAAKAVVPYHQTQSETGPAGFPRRLVAPKSALAVVVLIHHMQLCEQPPPCSCTEGTGMWLR